MRRARHIRKGPGSSHPHQFGSRNDSSRRTGEIELPTYWGSDSITRHAENRNKYLRTMRLIISSHFPKLVISWHEASRAIGSRYAADTVQYRAIPA
ncbi:hypothetical protein PUN4_1360014 [Paraburkholderia unamae]|nr:hypothetical protein PUN4_1360014 [Paraburkholderia unamae]